MFYLSKHKSVLFKIQKYLHNCSVLGVMYMIYFLAVIQLISRYAQYLNSKIDTVSKCTVFNWTLSIIKDKNCWSEISFCVLWPTGWLGALYQTWLSACPIRCGFIFSLMRVWAQLALRSTIRVHRLISSPTTSAFMSGPVSFRKLISFSCLPFCPSVGLPVLPHFCSLHKISPQPNLAHKLLTWTFIDNIKEGEKSSLKYLARLNPLLFPLPIPPSHFFPLPQKLTKRVVVTLAHPCTASKRVVAS